MKAKVDLSSYNNSWYSHGAGALKRLLWHYVNAIIFKTGILPASGVKVALLRLFGARIGSGVTIKPCVNIKHPWLLQIGEHSWIGENVWIDNLCPVTIGAHCCLSQGAMLLTGNHDYKKSAFDLLVKPILLEDGVWIGAQATVCPGVTCYSHAVLAVASVATADLESYTIYQGNPAARVRYREVNGPI